jgi:hypothetical protein
MSKTTSLREANQAFARCILEVEAGEEYVITRKGEPGHASCRSPGVAFLTNCPGSV